MSVAVSCSDGVTVVTLTSDPSSSCPPLCQLLGALCRCPGLCSVSCRLPPQRGGPQAALGALWIITGILHIGLGSIVFAISGGPLYHLRDVYSPLWHGVLFAVFGVSCVLTERSPRAGLTLLNGLLSLSGAALSVTGVVWFTLVLAVARLRSHGQRTFADSIGEPLSPEERAVRGRHQEAGELRVALGTGIFAVLFSLYLLDLCLGLLSATLSFNALSLRSKKSESESESEGKSEGESEPLGGAAQESK